MFNKFARVVAFLRANGVRVHENGDAPKFVEEEPEVYEKEELDKFFAACHTDEKLWFEFFLMTGMREQEVMYVYWKDIKFADSIGDAVELSGVGRVDAVDAIYVL